MAVLTRLKLDHCDTVGTPETDRIGSGQVAAQYLATSGGVHATTRSAPLNRPGKRCHGKAAFARNWVGLLVVVPCERQLGGRRECRKHAKGVAMRPRFPADDWP